ncbi:MAG: beta strand repeat-containing protein, partial [Hyphococcus sp.]
MNNLSVNLAGYSASKPTVGGTSQAIGVDGGMGDDSVMSDGRIVANAASTNTVRGNQFTLLGANQSTAEVGAFSIASGMLGGGGGDTLLNGGVIDVDGRATARLNSLSYTLAGASITDNAITASAWGAGFDGGAGDDVAGNLGDLFVDSNAVLSTSGAIGVSFGAAISGASTTSIASSAGILGGDGADTLFNTGFARVRSTATGTISRFNYAFIGGSSNAATAGATATSLGLGGGEGDDDIENTGALEVRASASTTASGNTISTVGGVRSTSRVSATARGVGVAGDSGADFIKNFGALTVTAVASPNSTNDANTGGFFTDGVTDSRTTASIRVVGVDAGAGENEVWNTGVLSLQTEGNARTESRSKGDILDNIFGLDLDADARATSSNNGQDARGVSAGGEATAFFNNGTVDVAIRGSGYAFSNADGDAVVDGDGTARATVGVSTARAYGFIAGGGGNTLVNAGDIIVLSQPTGNADARSDADGIDATSQPDSRATASIALNTARAAGVWFGDGADAVVNEGLIDVTAAPRADQAEADARFGGDVLGIDSFATATASANDASAYGVRAGGGANVVSNSGTIIARAVPRAVANADARGVGFDGDAEARATANARNARAYGIATGAGADLIWNTGTVTAISNPSVSTSVRADTGRACIIDVGDVEVCESGEAVRDRNSSVAGRTAIAVTTGGGDDAVINAGSIIASEGAATGNGDAVLLGSGNDMLALMDGSTTLGAISLGAGDDTLMLSGVATTNRAPNGSGGTDRLLFDGAGAFSLGFTSFEAARKINDGLFAVSALPTVATLEIQGGTLQSAAGYSFDAGGVYRTVVDASGAHGRFASLSGVNLAGAIEVTANSGLYTDGQGFDVVTGAAVTGG